jgi:hypothetical protein
VIEAEVISRVEVILVAVVFFPLLVPVILA